MINLLALSLYVLKHFPEEVGHTRVCDFNRHFFFPVDDKSGGLENPYFGVVIKVSIREC